ncbi:MAG: DUF1553 domain-containing protein, partial [Pirellulaceae bacterium]|nr:DUF1553 domain-containing protein [Pirellulaceae bacterium]
LARQIQRETATAPAMFEGSGVDEVFLVRGSTKTPASPVPRRFLQALAGPEPISIRSGSGRRELAETIASDQNPLTARVIVNRVWHHLFGRGIVPTVDNFGVLGQGPSHPELLDWLAVHFTTDLGWSIKSLVRELMLSRAYQMSSRPDDLRAGQLDPGFNAAAGGPSVPVHLTEFMEGRGRPQGGPLDGDGRRSLYIAVRRNFLPPFMLAFDTPIPFNTMGRRNVSNVPAQALFLMNDPLVVDLSRKWAQRILPQAADPATRVEQLYRTAFSRPPDAAELAAALAFLDSQRHLYGLPPDRGRDDERAWADLGHALFSVKEFIYLP